jgi:hypothetical protein
MIALIIVWGVIVWKLSNDAWMNGSLILAGAIITAVFMWWTRSTQTFAHNNPAQAMLEGAEFLEYHKFEAQAKGLPPAGPSVLTSDPQQPPPVISSSATNEPD